MKYRAKLLCTMLIAVITIFAVSQSIVSAQSKDSQQQDINVVVKTDTGLESPAVSITPKEESSGISNIQESTQNSKEESNNTQMVQEESGQGSANTSTTAQKANKVMLNVPIILQKPELYNGCEVTSLAMLLKYAGININKMTLAQEITKDKTPLAYDKSGNIVTWGDPNEGFVGDITGSGQGFGVYDKPMVTLLEKYMPGKSINLTGKSINTILNSINNGKPVVLWVTADFNSPDNFLTWNKGSKTIKVTLEEHAVLLVGYDKDYFYINNPLNGVKNQKVSRDTLIKVWHQMGSMAISYNK